MSHLNNKIAQLERIYDLKDNSIVLDIGSNDATSLKSYKRKKLKRIGIDPVGEKFRSFYLDEIDLTLSFIPQIAF